MNKTVPLKLAVCTIVALNWFAINESNVTASTIGATDDDAKKMQLEFNNSIRPILEKACGDCHWDSAGEAGINLESEKSLEQFLDASKKWRKVIGEVKSGTMPPEDASPLDAGDRKKLLSWLDKLYNQIDCTNIHPGNVTLRRLNGTEYRNTVRDLTGIDYRPASKFPGDDVGYNFDNIADTLSLPPLLMEKYLDAAEYVAGQTIFDAATPAIDVSISGANFRATEGAATIRDGRSLLTTNGRIDKEVNFARRGKYRMTVAAYGDQAGDEWVKMSVFIDKVKISVAEVKSRKRDPSSHEFEFTIKDPGKKMVGVRFENDYYRPRKVGREDRNLYVNGVKIVGPINAKQKPVFQLNVTGDRRSEDRATRKFINEFAPRAFRRPLKETDQTRLMKIYFDARDRGDSFYQAVQIVLQTCLVSPHFLYKVEQPLAVGQQRKLNDFELATSLSYFLWSTMPDEELTGLAAKGQLSDPDVYRRQINRMLQHRNARSIVENFVTQWLQLRALADAQPDPDLFEGADRWLLKDMVTETKMMFAEALAEDASIFDLLKTDYTYVNQRLAKHYGLDFRSEDTNRYGFQKSKFKNGHRGGLLTHGSILTLTSNPNRTSPVKRGKWIMENLLGEEPPPAITDIEPLDEQTELTGTLRERMEQHRSDPSCASCHRVMDTLGFALENFDGVGRWRETENGMKIDSTGELPDGTSFSGAAGLQTALQTDLKEQFLRCFIEKLMNFALGRGLQYYDLCTIDKIMEETAQSKFRIRAIITAVAESDPFLRRRGNPKTGTQEKPHE